MPDVLKWRAPSAALRSLTAWAESRQRCQPDRVSRDFSSQHCQIKRAGPRLFRSPTKSQATATAQAA